MQTLYKFGTYVCHQLPQRSLFSTYQSFVCARDIGIYSGILLGLLLIHLLHQKKASLNFTNSALLIIPLAIDGTFQSLGLWQSANSLRLLTGLLFGISMAYILNSLSTDRLPEAFPNSKTLVYALASSIALTFIILLLPNSTFLFIFLNTVTFITLLALIPAIIFIAFRTLNNALAKSTRI